MSIISFESRTSRQAGIVNVWMLVAITFIVLTVAASGVMIWAMLNYFDQRDNVDAKVEVAVADARKQQADIDEAKFLERDKQPNRQFVGPDDYGRVSFDYPKTWSVYVESDASSGNTYKAYLNPVSVPTVSATQQYGLRVLIESKDYDDVIKSYEAAVKKGDLKSTAIKAGDNNGTRLDGSFSRDIRGSAALFKIRDKTVTLRADAETFKGDFDAILATLTFNQ